MLIGSHNLPPELPWAVSMLRCKLADEIGNSLATTGTGFWIATKDGHMVFATNRHNVDATLAFRTNRDLAKYRVVGPVGRAAGIYPRCPASARPVKPPITAKPPPAPRTPSTMPRAR
jgi:hypothetical protein